MIYEYAVDPQFIVDLADKHDLASSLRRATGVGHPCIIAGYPEELGKKVRAIIKEKLSTAKDPKLISRLQRCLRDSTDLAASLTEKTRTTRRYGATIWNGDFCKEHERFPFAGILSTQAKIKDEASLNLPLLTIDGLRSDNCPYFKYPRAKRVLRNQLATELEPLLHNASTVIFIDPYFRPQKCFKENYKKYFKLLSNAARVRSTGPRQVAIICAVKTGRTTINAEDYKKICHERLPTWLPENIRLTIHRIGENSGGQQIHNRYIFTDIGGVFLGHGTDAPKDKRDSWDDISLLEAEQLAKWRNVYKPNSPDFVWSEPPIILSKE